MAQAQIDQEIEFFRGYKYVLSNFYYCKLVIDGQKFNSSEKAYQVMKAKFHKNKTIEDELMEAHFVSDVKKISEKIQVSAEWIDQRVDVMRKILRAKADQSQTYRKKLLNCKGQIVEAIRGDLFWSAGLDEKELRQLPRERWPGQNVLGQLHMELRDELQEFLRTQSQSKKRSVEWAEFVGTKKQKVEATKPSYSFETPNLNPTIEAPAISPPSYSFETLNLNPTIEWNLEDIDAAPAMFNTPVTSPVTEKETDAVEEFLQSVAAEVDQMLSEPANKGERTS